MEEQKLIQVVLKLFGLYKPESSIEVKGSENPYPHSVVTIFDYENSRYALVYDDTGDDNHDFILRQINNVSSGQYVLLSTPIPQSDGAQYAFGVKGREYYLARKVNVES